MLEPIRSPVRRAYALCALLTRARPSELGALRWGDVNVRERVLVLGNTKSGVDVRVPLSLWPGMRAAQRKVSRRILELLGGSDRLCR